MLQNIDAFFSFEWSIIEETLQVPSLRGRRVTLKGRGSQRSGTHRCSRWERERQRQTDWQTNLVKEREVISMYNFTLKFLQNNCLCKQYSKSFLTNFVSNIGLNSIFSSLNLSTIFMFTKWKEHGPNTTGMSWLVCTTATRRPSPSGETWLLTPSKHSKWRKGPML